MTGWWLRAAILATAASCAAQAADQDAPQRVLPSRRLVTPEKPNTPPRPDGSRVIAKTRDAQPPAPGADPAGAPPIPKPLPTGESPTPDTDPANDQPNPPVPPQADAPAPGEAAEPAPKPADPTQEPILPVSPPLERFKPLWLNSPFSRNILPENKASVAAAEFTLLGIGGLGEDKWCALVLDKKSQPQRRLLLFNDAADSQDRLVKVAESPNLDQVTAEIVIGGAPYVVHYDIASLKAQVAAPSPGQAHVPPPAIKSAPGQPPAPQQIAPPPSPVRVLPRRRYYPSSSNQKR